MAQTFNHGQSRKQDDGDAFHTDNQHDSITPTLHWIFRRYRTEKSFISVHL